MASRLTASHRRQQILDVASVLFAQKGYEGATTREIAEQAGVNEALLFRHFPSKENLYWTLIEEISSARGRQQRVREILAKGGPDEEVFRAVAREFLNRSERARELTRLLWFSALENHELSARFFNTVVAECYEALAVYIRRRIRQGVFRKCDPLLAARGFVGMVVYHYLIQEFFAGERYQNFDTDHVASTLTGIWLAGMQNPAVKRAGNNSNGHHIGAGKSGKHEH